MFTAIMPKTLHIEQVGSSDGVSVVRDGKTIAFSELEVADEE